MTEIKTCRGCNLCNGKGKPSVSRNSRKCHDRRKLLLSKKHEIASDVKQNKVFRRLKKSYNYARGRR